jgi:hypothetical protein
MRVLILILDSRLQKFVDRQLTRAQKGFTKSRQIQEVIIKIMENMDYCNHHGSIVFNRSIEGL